jgi:hypothetical protein
VSAHEGLGAAAAHATAARLLEVGCGTRKAPGALGMDKLALPGVVGGDELGGLAGP